MKSTFKCHKNSKKLNSPTLQKQQSKLKSTGKQFNFNVSSSRCQVIGNSLSKNKLPHYIPSVTPVPTQSNFSAKKLPPEKSNNPLSGFIPVPKGTPLFMFQGVEGKTRAVNWFFDSGCSHLCMRNEVPKEFESSLLQKGPFTIGGFGGVQVVANEEYLFTVKKYDGRV